MIEKAIENWLIKTNEKNYQLPFVQTLLAKGHKVIYISKHSQLEQGKDIVSIDSENVIHAYQLKGGNIDLSAWRSIKGEIQELIELPFEHPEIDKKIIHCSYLVTNGDVADTVRLQINQINEDNERKNRGYSYLTVINKETLLKDFIELQGVFIPKELNDFESFLKMYLADGRDFLDKKEFFQILENVVFSFNTKLKADKLNAIYASTVLTSYLLHSFQQTNNYYALFEGWIVLCSTMLHFAIEHKIDKTKWLFTFNLAFEEAIRQLENLKIEVLSRVSYIEGSHRGDGGHIYNSRITILIGVLSIYESFQKKRNNKYVTDLKIEEFVEDNIDKLCYWGESAFPFFWGVITFSELTGNSQRSKTLLDYLVKETVTQNHEKNTLALANPYYSATEVFMSTDPALRMLNIFDVIDFTSFKDESYCILPLIQLCARRGYREIVEENWKIISKLFFKEFSVEQDCDLLLYRCEKGVNVTITPKQTKSWSELIHESKQGEELKSLSKYSLFLPFFLAVYPHRATSSLMKLVDS